MNFCTLLQSMQTCSQINLLEKMLTSCCSCFFSFLSQIILLLEKFISNFLSSSISPMYIPHNLIWKRNIIPVFLIFSIILHQLIAVNNNDNIKL